jgi:hypothetical protein
MEIKKTSYQEAFLSNIVIARNEAIAHKQGGLAKFAIASCLAITSFIFY